MMQKKNRKQWATLRLILFIPIILLLLQAFARPELITKTEDFISVKYVENGTNDWLQKWTVENIGRGVFHPFGLKAGEFPSGSKNKLRISVHRNNRILFDREPIEVSEIKEYFKRYVQGYNPAKGEELESKEKDISKLGKVQVIDLLVHFYYDNMLSTDSVNPVLKLLGEAYFETKQNLAQKYFKQDYLELDEVKTEIIDIAVPIRFSCSDMVVYKSNPVEITLQKNEKLLAWNQEYTIDELEQELIKEKAILAKSDKDGYRYSLHPFLVIEDGVSEKQIAQIKEMFRKAEIQHINYSANGTSSISAPNTEQIKKEWAQKVNKMSGLNVLKCNAILLANNTITFKENTFLYKDFKTELLKKINEYQLSNSKGESTIFVVLTINTEEKVRKEQKEELLALLDDIDIVEFHALSNSKKPALKEVYQNKLYSKVKARVEDMDEITVEVQVSENTSSEKVERVYAELNKIPNLNIVKNVISKPSLPSPTSVNVLIKSNGEIVFEKHTYNSFAEFKKKLVEVGLLANEEYKKYGSTYSLHVRLTAEDGASAVQIKQVKEAITEANINHVNYGSGSNNLFVPFFIKIAEGGTVYWGKESKKGEKEQDFKWKQNLTFEEFETKLEETKKVLELTQTKREIDIFPFVVYIDENVTASEVSKVEKAFLKEKLHGYHLKGIENIVR